MTPTADRARGCPNMAAGRIISGSLTLLLLLVQPTHGLGGTRWATPDVEALDERRDAEIFQAVVDSMAEWQRRRDHKTSGRERRAADSVVCYEGVGCFRDAGPFSYLDMLPSPPDQVATHFLFYPPRHPHRAHPLPFANITTAPAPDSSPAPDPLPAAPAAPRRPARDSPPTISTSLSASPSDAAFVPATAFGPADWLHAGLNTTAPTKVIVHGFGSSCSNVWVFEMRSALMSVEDCNVICVDWEAGATIPNYVRAAANTRLVGKQLALLLTRLRDELGLDLHSVHLIGFSLGAHVAGFAGAELRDLISRITGLDPAGPLFENQDPAARLDASDAAFVDVIHSNGENLILGGLGSWQPMGHVDFYPNGGRMQKGCSNLFVGAVSDIFWSSREAHGRSLCNHRRAYKFFTDSVSPRCHFPAVPCESYDQFLLGECFPCSSQRHCGNMGYYADRSGGRGSLYLVTRDEEPFCAHQFLIRVESTPSALPVVSYGKLQVTLLGSAPQANETFTMTRKDDEELRAGGVLSRIVVPHPVMEEGPAQVELLYAAYSGWISSGLAKWSVDKISIGDSFGKSSSFCKRGLILESGVPVTVPVYPGDCNPPPSELTTSSAPPLSTTALAESGDGGPNDKESDAKKPAEPTDGGAATTPSPATTRPLSAVAVAAADDGGLDAAKGGLAHEEVTSNGNGGTWRPTDAAAPTTTAAPTPPSADPLVGAASGPPDEPRDSWQPLDGGGRRRDEAAAARAFLPRAAKRAPLAGNASILPQPPREWRPRHVPLPLLGRASEPREPWLAEMRPHAAGLDPPPIHAPLTWHHWAATFDEDEGDDEVEEASSTSAPPPSAEEEQRPANNSWALGPVIETVQLLPQRLVAFLARAEEYARVTLSGMVLGAAGNATTGADGAAGAAEGAASARRRAKLFPEEATSVGAMGRGLAHLYSSGAVVGGREVAEEASEAGHRPRYIPLQRPPEEAARRRSAGRAPSFPMPRRR